LTPTVSTSAIVEIEVIVQNLTDAVLHILNME
jgi:hypothetical protein